MKHNTNPIDLFDPLLYGLTLDPHGINKLLTDTASPTLHSASNSTETLMSMAGFPQTLADRVKSKSRRTAGNSVNDSARNSPMPILLDSITPKQSSPQQSFRRELMPEPSTLGQATSRPVPKPESAKGDKRSAEPGITDSSTKKAKLGALHYRDPQKGTPTVPQPRPEDDDNIVVMVRPLQREPDKHISFSVKSPSSSPEVASLSQTHPNPAANVAEAEVTTTYDIRSTAQFHDASADRRFVEEMKSVLSSWQRAKRLDARKRQARRILALLDVAAPPIPNVEAHFATAKEAERLVAPNVFFDGPIFTEGQQALPLQTVNQFLSEYYDENLLADIQDPSMNISPHTRRVTIAQVKARFLRPKKSGEKPWNLLEMATHADEGIKPQYLNNEDCRLITKLKIPSSLKVAHRRGYQPGYKEVERWALLAQAGALTAPHQDSHGYSTFITCNEGDIGFGWLSHPSPRERAEWECSTGSYTGGRWRYVVLRPGQTVYFPAGTVHFVFRHPSSGDTLAFGGHVLRCSNLVHWIKTMLAEKRAVYITNEELSVTAPGFLEAVEIYLKQAEKQGSTLKWGGLAQIKEFLKLKDEFLSLP